jgi:hypothetical protein
MASGSHHLSLYLSKKPRQMPDDLARDEMEKFIRSELER